MRLRPTFVAAITLLAALLPSCVTRVPTAPPANVEVKEVRAPDGAIYRVWEDESGDLYDQEEDLSERGRVALRSTRGSDVYGGTCRKKAKLSFPDVTTTTFASIDAFLAAVPTDSVMQGKGITEDAMSDRIAEENKMVTFPAWIVASNKPKDNDYHVIIGNHPTEPSVAINVEVSGLASMPADASFTTQANADQLVAARTQYKAGMGDRLPSSGYKHYDPGIPVQITGAAFYDKCHSPGEVGPAKWRTILTTCWEVHPVSEVAFTSAPTPPENGPWINEFHYNDTGSDDLELVEVAGPAGTDLAGWTLVGYNGTGGAPYKTVTLSGVIADQANGIGAIDFAFVGLQNGDPDGIALVNSANEVVQFISYGGQFTAASGPAAGQTSQDVGHTESNFTSSATSIQLTGTGNRYTAFTWQAGVARTPGAINNGQTWE